MDLTHFREEETFEFLDIDPNARDVANRHKNVGVHARHGVVFNDTLGIDFAYMRRKGMVVLQQVEEPLDVVGVVKHKEKREVEFTDDLGDR